MVGSVAVVPSSCDTSSVQPWASDLFLMFWGREETGRWSCADDDLKVNFLRWWALRGADFNLEMALRRWFRLTAFTCNLASSAMLLICANGYFEIAYLVAVLTATLSLGQSETDTTVRGADKQQFHCLWYYRNRTVGLISKFINPFRKLLRESNCCLWPLTLHYRKSVVSLIKRKRIFGKRIAAYLQKLSTRGVQCVGNMQVFLTLKQVV
jgi:hypothetical protein